MKYLLNWNKKDIINICKIVAFGIILYWLLENIGILGGIFKLLCEILSPFIIGIAIAFVINVPMTIFEKRILINRKKGKKTIQMEISKGKRLSSIVLSLIIVILIIVGIVFLVIPEIVKAIGNMISYLPQALTNAKEIIKDLTVKYPDIEGTLNNFQKNLEIFNSETIKELTSIGTSLVTSSFGVISSTLSWIFKIIIAIIFAIYILMGKEKIFLHLKRILYAYLKTDVADKISRVAVISKDAFNSFVTGQFTECIILGSLCAIGMFILGLPYGATVGVLVAVTAFIPIVGAMIGGFIGVVLLLPISLGKAITFLIFFVILQQIENNLIYPRVVGKSVGVPGILVLVAVTIGGAIGGAVGMVISLPLTSVLYTLLNESVNKRLKEKKYEKT